MKDKKVKGQSDSNATLFKYNEIKTIARRRIGSTRRTVRGHRATSEERSR